MPGTGMTYEEDDDKEQQEEEDDEEEDELKYVAFAFNSRGILKCYKGSFEGNRGTVPILSIVSGKCSI